MAPGQNEGMPDLFGPDSLPPPLSLRARIFRALALPLMVIVFVSSIAPEADARRRRRSRTKRAAIVKEKNLYERLGGAKAVSGIVDEWLRLSLADARISAFFEKTTAQPDRLARLRRSLGDQVCEITDGPCRYKGGEMGKVHEGMGIAEDHFLAFSENLFKSMQKFSVPEREKNELLGRLGALRAEMLTGSDD